MSTDGKDIETTKPTFLTTKPTEFVKPTTSIKTNPDGNVHNFISIIIFHVNFVTCMKPRKYFKFISDDGPDNANPWVFGFAVKNQVEGHVMMLLIVSLFLFMI